MAATVLAEHQTGTGVRLVTRKSGSMGSEQDWRIVGPATSYLGHGVVRSKFVVNHHVFSRVESGFDHGGSNGRVGFCRGMPESRIQRRRLCRSRTVLRSLLHSKTGSNRSVCARPFRSES